MCRFGKGDSWESPEKRASAGKKNQAAGRRKRRRRGRRQSELCIPEHWARSAARRNLCPAPVGDPWHCCWVITVPPNPKQRTRRAGSNVGHQTRRGDVRVHPSAHAKPCWAGGADAENAIPAQQIPALPLLEAGEEEEQRGGFGSPKISSLCLA